MKQSRIAERELELLESIYRNRSAIKQRDLAKIVGLSVGMTNSILKRLAQKGWLTIRKVNNRNIHYVVSPEGIEALMRRSYRYFKRTIKNVVLYKDAMERLVSRVVRERYTGLVLVGESDLDFLVEHECLKHALPFHREKAMGEDDNFFYLYGEEYRPALLSSEENRTPNASYLYDLYLDRQRA
jgi:DNA-binding MarR family transcriptional regulator